MERTKFFETLKDKILHVGGRKLWTKRLILQSGLFDENYYLAHNPDVTQTGIEPLDHFIRHGGFEARKPHPDFDPEYYLDHNPDVKEAGMNPLVHYLLYGKREGRQISPSSSIYEVFHNVNDEKWLEILIRSINQPIINGITLPQFPNAETQRAMVGSANEQALREAYLFYQEIKRYAQIQGISIDKGAYILDFGCGWGRHYRFFLKDLPSQNLFGIDSFPLMIEICKTTIPMGNFEQIDLYPPTNLLSSSFHIIYAYSVFSHLNERIGLAWINEFARLLKSGGLLIVTTQAKSFFEFCESFRQHPETQTSEWHQMLAQKAFLDLQKAYDSYEKGEFLYAATVDSEYFPADIYGEAVLSPKYVKTMWTKQFDLVDFVDDPLRLPQSLIVLRRK